MASTNASFLSNVKARENSILKNVYLWMSAGLALTAVVSYAVASSDALMKMFFSSGFSFIFLFIIQIGLVNVSFYSYSKDVSNECSSLICSILYSYRNHLIGIGICLLIDCIITSILYYSPLIWWNEFVRDGNKKKLRRDWTLSDYGSMGNYYCISYKLNF